MRNLLSILLFAFLLMFGTSNLYAQSGAKLSMGYISIKHDMKPSTSGQLMMPEGNMTGWDIRLSGRLGSRLWFFSPTLIYQNTNVVPIQEINPFFKTARIHTLRIPISVGMKIRTTPFQKIFVKGGLIGSYVLIIDENEKYDFNHIVDTYFGYFGMIGYDFHWFTVDYRYEKTIGDNFFNSPGSELASHSVSLGINF